MGAAFDLEPSAPMSQNLRDLKEMQIARVALITDRTRLLNRLKTQTLAINKRHTTARLAQIARQIHDLDGEIQTRITAEKHTARTHHILCSIPGIGAITAAAVLIEMPEIGTMTRKQVASLAGLAPMTRQSGQWNGKAFIQGGRKHLRDALYMPALVAMRFNPDLKAIYDKLRNAGKPAKVDSPPSCENSSNWQIPSSKQIAFGCQKGLDQDGYSKVQHLLLGQGPLSHNRDARELGAFYPLDVESTAIGFDLGLDRGGPSARHHENKLQFQPLKPRFLPLKLEPTIGPTLLCLRKGGSAVETALASKPFHYI